MPIIRSACTVRKILPTKCAWIGLHVLHWTLHALCYCCSIAGREACRACCVSVRSLGCAQAIAPYFTTKQCIWGCWRIQPHPWHHVCIPIGPCFRPWPTASSPTGHASRTSRLDKSPFRSPCWPPSVFGVPVPRGLGNICTARSRLARAQCSWHCMQARKCTRVSCSMAFRGKAGNGSQEQQRAC